MVALFTAPNSEYVGVPIKAVVAWDAATTAAEFINLFAWEALNWVISCWVLVVSINRFDAPTILSMLFSACWAV